VNFNDHLARQLKSLETSCREYDSGNRDEAIRMATPLRVIFHQDSHSTSLMTHLGAGFLRLLSTSTKMPKNNPSGCWFALVQWELDPQNCIFRCRPKFDATRVSHRDLLLDDWWGTDPIYRFGHKKIRRKDLVLVAADKDGGCQADSELPHDYRWLIDGAGWKMNVRPDNGPEREVVLHDAHLAALRQIAHEVFNSRAILNLAADRS
jgi:hypothetical protein